MRRIIYAIYLFGAIAMAVTEYFLDPVTALLILLLLPMAAITFAEAQGFIQFAYHEMEEDEDNVLRQAMLKNLSPEEAAEKYGQALVNEMDIQIKDVETSLNEMKQAREEASNHMRGIK